MGDAKRGFKPKDSDWLDRGIDLHGSRGVAMLAKPWLRHVGDYLRTRYRASHDEASHDGAAAVQDVGNLRLDCGRMCCSLLR